MTKRIHTGILKPSDPDTIALAQAVEEKFLELSGAWLRIRGEQIPITPSLDVDLLRWREMRVRHKKGDFRHSEVELLSTRTIAQWTVDMNCKLRNQPTRKIDWERRNV